ncbi:TetR/AcrR family transcriptional regulator [Blastococcus haudaquaticus]|uniref:Transcriptional regulator, TetR family n=1 Tax=Blastococcus haudaquaticus TaxID=1938745 RepID=A0A286GTG9_9ACTN|nr:TetR/AcrR family transcriptional regulator [Blastococcus haudaquaticus]SOD98732.1 transcriptional regulator, TetR family [Blastococcus haudaquaticus]
MGSDEGGAVGRRATYHHGDLRAALVDAALELVATKGVAGVSMAEAARRVGVSSAAPYRHFAGRTALLSAAATVAGQRLSEQMRAAAEQVRATGEGDPVTQAIETLAALAAVYVRFTLAHGATFELILADELQDFPDEERRAVTRAMFDHLLWPAVTVTGDVMTANPLLRSFTAAVHGFAYLPRGGFTRGFPVDLRGFAAEGDLVADEAARAVRTLARAFVPDPADGTSSRDLPR